MIEQVGQGAMARARNLARIRDELKVAGYKGERVAVLSADDIGLIRDYASITADLLTKIGMNVDLQSMDWGTLLARRTSWEPVSNGSWSVFPCAWSGVLIGSPPSNLMVRGIGSAGSAGDFSDPAIEELTTRYVEAGPSVPVGQLVELGRPNYVRTA